MEKSFNDKKIIKKLQPKPKSFMTEEERENFKKQEEEKKIKKQKNKGQKRDREVDLNRYNALSVQDALEDFDERGL